MPKVAYLTCAALLADAPRRREDAREHDLQASTLRAGCAEHGIELVDVAWNDPDLDVAGFDAFLIGTTWDYMDVLGAFLGRLTTVAAARPLFNGLDAVRWNLNKSYLRDLQSAGVPIVPTLFEASADARAIERAFDTLETDHIVVKPDVGAGAWRQVKLRRGDALPAAQDLPPAGALIQPYLASITTEGECSFLFFGDVYSHCAKKRPAQGDYRSQAMYGAKEEVYMASEAEIALARTTLNAAPEDLLYARVDMVRDEVGQLALMELEIVEPYLYPEQGPDLGLHFASALASRL
jgi:glutathione synthase/RimK-type ligase-like ATP-grasp enzyme